MGWFVVLEACVALDILYVEGNLVLGTFDSSPIGYFEP